MKRVKKTVLGALILSVCLLSGCVPETLEDASPVEQQETETQAILKERQPKCTEDGIGYSFRTHEKKFQVYQKNGTWEDMVAVGVNIGAAKPGAFPGEFAINKNDYLRWFKQISEMHADTIRVYTILMPEFYQALAEYNQTASKPLYFMQGVYNNEEDISRLGDAFDEEGKIAGDWVQMCQTIVDVVHGNAEIEPLPGNASGSYTADVSQYLSGWILGIEWQADFVINTNEQHKDRTSYDGEYLYTKQASPFEIFLATGLDACISYETKQYKMQHPTAFANWVTTDPLDHPGEPSPEMEDAVSVDAEHIKAKPEFLAGFFASYHVYPYYPEMMRYAPELLKDDPPNSYRRYLMDLNAYHSIPVIVSEFGVPASRGVTHLARDPGYNQGGLGEKEQGKAIVSMLDDIIDSGCAGAYVFIWQDEWFKRTWNTMDFTDAENRPYWCDVQTSEQFFGLLSFDPGEQPVCIVDGDAKDWEGEKPLLVSGGAKLYVKSDEAYVYLMIQGKHDRLRITMDTIKGQGNQQEGGADFSLELDGRDQSRLMIHPYYDVNYWLYTEGIYGKNQILEEREGYAAPENNTFVPIQLMLNRPLQLPDGTKVETELVETGKLRHGNADPQSPQYDSRADFCIKEDVTEVRLPWLLLNIPKPNVKMCIANLYAHQEITYEVMDHIIFSIDGVSGFYSWEPWELPTYRERLKKSYYILQDYLSKR